MASKGAVAVFSISLVLLVGLVSGYSDLSETYGEVGPNDVLLHSVHIDVGFFLMKTFEEEYNRRDVKYPPSPDVKAVNLTCIKVIDTMFSFANSLFRISEGGINQTHATISFRSYLPGSPIMYNVEFYGPSSEPPTTTPANPPPESIPDAPAETVPDVPAETVPDVPAENTPDVPAETIPDAPAETNPDVPAETIPDGL